jgi:uncharacterized protein (TIGR02147 family)
MLKFIKPEISIVSKSQYEFFRQWFYSAIREVLHVFSFKNDYAALAKKLDPPISAGQAKKAIGLLKKLGMVEKDSKGFLRPAEPLISTGKEFQSLNVANFQMAMLDLAKEAYGRHPRDKRDMTTLTLSFSREDFSKAREMIGSLQEHLLLLAKESKAPDRVYQLNFHMFPLTKC